MTRALKTRSAGMRAAKSSAFPQPFWQSTTCARVGKSGQISESEFATSAASSGGCTAPSGYGQASVIGVCGAFAKLVVFNQNKLL